MRYAIYMRVARKNQIDSTQEAIYHQDAALTDYAEKNGLEIVEKYSDVAFSGTDTNRPGLQALISDYNAGKFDGVLTFDLSRLSRKPTPFPFPVKTIK